jgi:hypothetical protein
VQEDFDDTRFHGGTQLSLGTDDTDCAVKAKIWHQTHSGWRRQLFSDTDCADDTVIDNPFIISFSGLLARLGWAKTPSRWATNFF